MKSEEIRAGVNLAYLEDGPADDGGQCGFFWLGGFMSDMTGSKAEALAALAGETGRPGLRFDYSGHGASGGQFLEATISDWLAEAVNMFQVHTRGPRIVIGSSMGGWLALLLHRALQSKRVAGMVLVAPAVDMTKTLMWDTFTGEARQAIQEKGVWHRPSAYGVPYPITRKLIEDGQNHLLMASPYRVNCPVHILQGDADEDVPWSHARRVYDMLEGPDIEFTLIKGGDHRLSSPLQLQRLREAADALARRVP